MRRFALAGEQWTLIEPVEYRNRLRSWTEVFGSSARHGSSQYDALSRRVRKEADTDGDGAIDDTAHFIYAGQADWQLIEEWDGPGPTPSASRTRDYVYGNYIDELVHSRDLTGATAVEWFHHQDDVFSIVASTDAGGAVVERYQYGDYGDRRVLAPDGTPRSSSTIRLRHGFTGQIHDDESGLILMRFRHLNPRDGKWLQRDPAWYVDGAGLSTYVLSNPSRNTDRFGERVEESGGGRSRGRPDLCGIRLGTRPYNPWGHQWIEIYDYDNERWDPYGWTPGTSGNPFGSPGLWYDPKADPNTIEPGVWPGPDPFASRSEKRKKYISPSLIRHRWEDDLSRPRNGPQNTGEYHKKKVVCRLKHGSGVGKAASDATCDDFRSCLQKARPTSPSYWYLGNNCGDAVDDVLSQCCLSD